MDFTTLSRQYGEAGVGLMLDSDWDFNIDRSWHGHIAIMRGGGGLLQHCPRSNERVPDRERRPRPHPGTNPKRLCTFRYARGKCTGSAQHDSVSPVGQLVRLG